MSLLKLSTAAIALTLLSAGTVQAATFKEIGDAGTFPNSRAQVASVVGQLDGIAGFLDTSGSLSDIDVFQVSLNAGYFSARVADPGFGMRSLFLFDSNGFGLATHKSSGTYALIEGMLPVTGTYFLGIGEGAIDWKSRAGSIFSSSDWASSQFGATGAGAGMKVNSVNRSRPGAGGGGYAIALSYLKPSPPGPRVQKVPESGSLVGLALVGALLLLQIRRL